MTQLLFTKGVQEYRRTIPFLVTKQDIVLEIGFAWGTTTQLLAQYAKHVVGIDKGKSYLHACMKYPHLELYQIDGFDIRRVLQLGYQFNKIYLDISGCRDMYSILRMIEIYRGAFRPELMVVKSSKLKRFVSQCQTWNG